MRCFSTGDYGSIRTWIGRQIQEDSVRPLPGTALKSRVCKVDFKFAELKSKLSAYFMLAVRSYPHPHPASVRLHRELDDALLKALIQELTK